MSGRFIMSARQAAELADAFARNGWTEEDVKNLFVGNLLADVRKFVHGTASLTVLTHLIDLDAPPKPYNNWEAVEHHKGGMFTWSSANLALYLHPSQQETKQVKGEELRKRLARANKVCFNANLLDYLLEHPELIPEEWKQNEKGNTHYIFFHGTVYRDSRGDRCVRCLCWYDGRWQAFCRWLGHGWFSLLPSLVRA